MVPRCNRGGLRNLLQNIYVAMGPWSKETDRGLQAQLADLDAINDVFGNAAGETGGNLRRHPRTEIL
jgi:hypothetical protein